MGQVIAVRGQPHVIVAGLLLLLPSAGGCAQPSGGKNGGQKGPSQVAHTSTHGGAAHGPVVAQVAQDLAAQALVDAARYMADYDAERAAAALSEVPSEQLSPAARYLLARALASADRHAEAADALPPSGDGLPEAVANQLHAQRAQWLAKAGRCDEALPALAPLTAEDRAPATLLVHQARCQQQKAATLAAVTSYERALERDPKGRQVDRVEVQLALAELFAAQGEEQRAFDLLRHLYIRFPADRRIADIEQRLQTLSKANRRLGKPLALSALEADERAQALFDAKAYEEAAAAFKAIKLPRKQADQAELLYRQGMAWFDSRKHYAEAAKVLARSARLGGKHEAAAGFHAARALARADRDRAAVKAFARFIKKYPRGQHTADAAYLQAWLSTRHGFAGGHRLMEHFISGRHGRRAPGLRSEGQFQLAMDAFKRRRYDDAHRLFIDYADGRGEMVRARGLYWAAQAASELKRIGQAQRYYEEIRQDEPLNYYALLATMRMKEAGETPEPMLAPVGEPTAISPSPLPALATFYLDLGLIDDAAKVIKATEPRAIHRRGAALEEVLPWAARYGAMGDHHRAYQLLGPFWSQFSSRPASGIDHLAWHLSYARPAGSAVTRASERFGIAPEFIYSIMRKESAFQSQVVSYADAIGLLQLLPETAAVLAVGLRELEKASDFDRRRLLQPAENIWLGAAYLAELSARYPQHPALAIAAYNAGEHQVDAWLKLERPRNKRTPFRFDLFVERIPITQTRNYVRRVLTNWACYRYLAGEVDKAPWSLTL